MRPPTPQALLQHPALWRGSDLARPSLPGLSTGFDALDAELPGGGWPAGSLTEIMPAHEGIGELRLLGPVLAQTSRRGKNLAWIAPPHRPYAPALAAAGVDLARMLIVCTGNARESLWAAEEALRCGACGAVLLWQETVNHTALRRLQLAAGDGCMPMFLFRPHRTQHSASPATLRLCLETADGGLAVRIIKRRGFPPLRPIFIATGIAAERNHHSSSHHALDRTVPAEPAAGDFSPRRVHA